MSVAIKKVEGVQDVKVSLNDGTVAVKLKDGNEVTIEEVRDIIRKNGFTPKEAQVKVLGKVSERDGKPELRVTGLDAVFLLRGDTSKVKEMLGEDVLVAGQVPETTDHNAPATLLVKGVSALNHL